MTQASVLAQLGSAGVSQGFKNRIINGAMVIDQRNAGASVTLTPTGPVAVTAGETWHFQCWFRDVAGSAATSNFSDGLRITFN